MISGLKTTCFYIGFLLAGLSVFSQVNPANRQSIIACGDAICKTKKAIATTEWHLEADNLDKSQQWLNYAKKQNQAIRNDTLAYLINSLQSEIFYYLGLYQFGQHEAQKGIEQAQALHDSVLLSDAYFFRGINQFEMNRNSQALQSLVLAERHFPNQPRKYIRSIISKSHIYNNIAQVKLKLGETDSAVYYNNRAYSLAKKNNNTRVISNAEQIFGMIYLEQQKMDSARFYYNKSIVSATAFRYHDIALLSTGYLMNCYPLDVQKIRQLYDDGTRIMAAHNVNILYRKYFYAAALEAFAKTGDRERIVGLQRKLIGINTEMNDHENFYIQDITEDYMKSENDLLTAKINELNQQKNITILQLVAALLCVLVLLFVIIIFRRKNKMQKLLLDQKNEISKDLHDDIGSELSSILINANLLIGNYDTNEKQQFLLAKISNTSAEISQRLNAFIWSLNNENDSIESFCEYVNQYAGKLFDGTAISWHYSDDMAAVENKILNGYFRKNLFFCIKEALNNAIKHAQATQVHLSIAALDKKELQISISDNGIGIQQENTFGNGFKNIKKRVEVLKGRVSFDSKQGLRITITAPIPDS